MVIYVHSMSVLNVAIPREYLNWFHFDGVALFFVLSGFLIGRILLKTTQQADFNFKALCSFWARRWLRTLPAYFVVLTVLIILLYVFNSPMVGTPFYEYYLFIQNIWHPHPSFFPEAWSLSVEEWFYLVFPFSLFIACRFFSNIKKPFLFLVIGFILFGLIYRYFVCQHIIQSQLDMNAVYSEQIRKMVLARIDSIMYGVLGAYVFLYFPVFWQKIKNPSFMLGVLGLLFVKLFPWHEHALIKGIFFSPALSIAVLLLLPKLNALRMGQGQQFWKKIIVFISVVSYSAYLLNSSIINFLKRFLDFQSHPFIFCLVAWGLTFFASYLLYTCVEYPMMKWRDRRWKKVSVKNESTHHN